MATYATKQQLTDLLSKKFLIQLSDDDENGVADDGPITLALDNAEAIVNSFLVEAGYLVPVALPFPAGAEALRPATLWLAT